MWISSVILGALGLVPGFPFLPFLLLGRRHRQRRRTSRARPEVAAADGRAAWRRRAAPTLAEPAAQMRELLAVEPLEVEVGYALVPLVDEKQHGDLLQRIGIMRKQVALELGIIVPPARIRDNIQLPATEYAIKLRGIKVAGGEVMPRHLLALNTSGSTRRARRRADHRSELRHSRRVDLARPAGRGGSGWLRRGRGRRRCCPPT